MVGDIAMYFLFRWQPDPYQGGQPRCGAGRRRDDKNHLGENQGQGKYSPVIQNSDNHGSR